MELFRREQYLSKIRGFYHDTDIIKVITGVRRCGKSSLMEMIKDELIASGVSEKCIIYMDLDSRKYRKIKTDDEFEKIVDELSITKETKYLFVDEIQNIENFEEIINAFRNDGDYSIFITGSNSYLLSGELATKLTGRYVEFELFTLNFNEYLSMKEFYQKPIDKNINIELDKFLREGGFPRTVRFDTAEEKQAYVKSVTEEIFEKDIKKRVKADTVRELKNELMALPEQIGALPIDEHFEENIFALFVAFKVRYGTLKDFDYDIDIKNNKYYVSYQTVKYNYSTGAYHLEKEEIKRTLMSPEKLQEYRASRNIKPEPVVPQEQKPETEEELHKPRIVVEGEDPSKVKVTNRTIQLATTRRQVIDRAKGLVIKNADSLTVSLIKQGLRIKYNEHLRDQLKSLNAKLSLVNKSNYRSRKDIKFQGDETEQDLAFKTPKDKFNIEDYKLEFRLIDEEKKRSDLLYTFDLDNISDELHGRTK